MWGEGDWAEHRAAASLPTLCRIRPSFCIRPPCLCSTVLSSPLRSPARSSCAGGSPWQEVPQVGMSPPSPHQEAPLPDLDAAYAEALAVASSGRRGSEAQLLRLMQRTGCCWGELQPGTAQGLMEAFTARLQVWSHAGCRAAWEQKGLQLSRYFRRAHPSSKRTGRCPRVPLPPYTQPSSHPPFS